MPKGGRASPTGPQRAQYVQGQEGMPKDAEHDRRVQSVTTATCVDVGSTYTKAALVDLDGGRLVRRAEVPTSAATDVLTGLDEAVAAVGGGDRLYVCSSAGGGLRLAVVGYEALVTAEAGHRVGLSAG